MLTYLRSHPTMVLMVPKADTSEHFTALLLPCPAFLGEEDDTTEKEPCQKTGSVPPFRKDTALRGLSAPLSLIPSSDITFLSSCRIHNMWTRVLRCNEGQGTLVATRLRYSVSNFLSRLLRHYYRLDVSIWTSHWHLRLDAPNLDLQSSLANH